MIIKLCTYDLFKMQIDILLFIFFFRVMEEDKDNKIYTVNLHKIVTRECGKPPFNNCYMMKKPHDVVSLCLQ